MPQNNLHFIFQLSKYEGMMSSLEWSNLGIYLLT